VNDANLCFWRKNMDESQSMMPPLQTPGAVHEAFAPLIGRWRANTKAFSDPNAPPFETQGTEETYWVLGGLGVAYSFQGDFGPAKFHGFGFTTWNVTENCYHGYWYDSLTPAGPTPYKGHYDAERRALTTIKEGPGCDGQIITQRMIDTIHDSDHRTFEIYTLRPEGDQLALHIDYTRERAPVAAPKARAMKVRTKPRPRPKPKLARRPVRKPKAKKRAKTASKGRRKTAKKAKRR